MVFNKSTSLFSLFLYINSLCHVHLMNQWAINHLKLKVHKFNGCELLRFLNIYKCANTKRYQLVKQYNLDNYGIIPL